MANMMQEKGCPGFVRHVMFLFSLQFDQTYSCKNSSLKLLLETHPAYVS